MERELRAESPGQVGFDQRRSFDDFYATHQPRSHRDPEITDLSLNEVRYSLPY